VRSIDVEDVMRTDAATCRESDSLAEAARRLESAGAECLPVLDAAGQGRLVGMLTARDLCRAVACGGLPPERTRVGEAMGEKVATCWPDDSLESVVAILRAYGGRELPVVDTSRRLLGMVGLSEVAGAMLQDGASCGSSLGEIVEALAGLRLPAH
jgi:CBS domain-containing protein